MAERSFHEEVKLLRLGNGEQFHGEGILAVTKALLQSGVSYLGGYQGAPVSHLMDVFSDANSILSELGVRFEASGSEATACAMMAASMNYPLRGAVAWKSVVGTNVASDALANIASSGVVGGCLVIIGEDYGEGSSIMQERTHAFAMKSQVWLLDPRPNLPKIVEMVEKGFQLSEASNTPVMLELRIRACHVHGSFEARDNKKPDFSTDHFLENPIQDYSRIVLPPSNFVHEVQKVEQRWPAAQKFVRDQRLNEFFGPESGDLGLIVQGGLYNTLNRALEKLGLSDVFGDMGISTYCLNVTYPLVDEEIVSFCNGKKAVLVIEEGQPEFIEQAIAAILHRADVQTRVHGKDFLSKAGEYTAEVIHDGLRKFLEHAQPNVKIEAKADYKLPADAFEEVGKTVPMRPAGFCTGCPERPIFTAMKLLEKDIGKYHVSCDIGCHTFSVLPPFNIGNTTMGYGLGYAGASAFSSEKGNRAMAVMGDGGFWHNGLTSGVTNAVFNKSDNVLVVVDNNYAAGTGGQDVPSTRTDNSNRATGNEIEDAVKGVGVKWVRKIDRTYDLKKMRDTLHEAMTTKEKGPKVIIAQSECMLNKQRREKPKFNKAVKAGKKQVRERFGVDPDTCTGDHSCIRLSGCPSLGIKENPDPLRKDPIAAIQNSCVGCGLCGEVSHAVKLCPSFYKAEVVYNPTRWDRIVERMRVALISPLQRLRARRRQAVAI